MLEQTYDKYTVRYERDSIILEGDPATIREEAERILRRFAYSTRPYRKVLVDDYCVVLTVPH